MQEYLIQKEVDPTYKEELPILEMQYMESSANIDNWTSKFKKLSI